ncbi:cytoadherence linked asexual protein, partial [Plasmodium gaboni]
MVLFLKTCIFNIIFILYINENVIYSKRNEYKNETIIKNIKNKNKNINKNVNDNDNINQLKSMIGNNDLHKNLKILEKLILESLEKDKLRYPVIKEDTEQLLDISKFKKKYIIDKNEEYYVIPTLQSTFHDIVKYEYYMKGQLIEVYNSNISDIIKKKLFIVRTLKTIKLMLIPLNYYKQNNDLKIALEELNNVFISKNVEEKSINPIIDDETFFSNLINDVSEIKKNKEIENKGETLILGDNKID